MDRPIIPGQPPPPHLANSNIRVNPTSPFAGGPPPRTSPPPQQQQFLQHGSRPISPIQVRGSAANVHVPGPLPPGFVPPGVGGSHYPQTGSRVVMSGVMGGPLLPGQPVPPPPGLPPPGTVIGVTRYPSQSPPPRDTFGGQQRPMPPPGGQFTPAGPLDRVVAQGLGGMMGPPPPHGGPPGQSGFGPGGPGGPGPSGFGPSGRPGFQSMQSKITSNLAQIAREKLPGSSRSPSKRKPRSQTPIENYRSTDKSR